MFSISLARLRLLGLLEGSSFLLLLGVAMPLKYLAGMPQMVRVVGALHGALFVLFVGAVLRVAIEQRWPVRAVLEALAAAVLPFGPFVLDARLRRSAPAAAEPA